MKAERNIEEILRPPFMLTHQLCSIHKKKNRTSRSGWTEEIRDPPGPAENFQRSTRPGETFPTVQVGPGRAARCEP